MSEHDKRLGAVNELIKTIASCGRKFFAHEDRTAYLERDYRGRIWIHDEYSGKRIYTHDGDWRGFNHGGTMKSLIRFLRDYIAKGKPVPARVFGPWPKHVCDGDLWGYGEDMEIVRKKAAELGLLK